MVPLAGDHFGGCVAGRPAGSLEGASSLIRVTEAEIDKFDVFVLVKQQVFRL